MKKTEIIILGTIHNFHNENPYFSYEHVFKLIEHYKPDCIGVEIREEDFNQSREYLNDYYPYEMIETKYRFKKDYDIVGFDFYEDDVVKKTQLEKAFETDQQFLKERKLLETIDQIRMNLILNRSAQEINDGRYDVASKIYYRQLEILFDNTPYQEISDFCRIRDQHIDENIINIISNHKGSRLMFIMGVDHRVFAIEKIKETFKDAIEIVPIISNEYL